ncbi:MAG TPA: ceramidase domain-containing protein [Alphaproteobacteria bacterium]|nr:ceramidase domain-containing protein [Alphaproteobacteria bacterium]
MMSLPAKKGILLATALLLVAVTFFFPPIAQDLAYHDFADKRPVQSVPNAGDVLSNIPFCIVGLWGLFMMRGYRAGDKTACALWLVFFFGVFLVGFGSGYYHWAPDNKTLVWDRLPMTIAFMSLFSLVIAEHVSRRLGYALFPLFLAAGIGSVWYWDYTEGMGAGDLRPYALVQFLPMVLILMMVAMFRTHAGGTRYLMWCLGWYLAAKGLEHYDDAVFSLLGQTVSGHSLKHLAAAAGVACLLPYAKLRLEKPAIDV